MKIGCPPFPSRIKILDFLIFAIILGVGFWSLFFVPSPEDDAIYIYQDGRPLAKYSLSHPPLYQTVQGKLGPVQIKFEKNGVRVVKSTCRNSICRHTGKISRPGESIICVPNHLMIVIGDSKQGRVDGVTK